MRRLPYLLTVVLTILILMFFNTISQAQTSFNVSNKTTGDTLLTIDNDGDVGIGTTTPAVKFDLRSEIADDHGRLWLGNSDLSHFLRFFSGRQNSPNPGILWNEMDALRFGTSLSGFTEYMRISNNGNVGIGTTNPLTKLQINGALSISDTIGLPDETNYNLYMAGNYNNGVDIGKIYVGDNTGWRFHFASRTGNTDIDLITIRDNGNVGIGVADPAEMLQVADTIHSTVGGFKFPDNTVQETAATGGGASSIDELSDAITGGNSIFLGAGAGINDDSSDNRNSALGINALTSNTTGYGNAANGYQALSSNTEGWRNTANGNNALSSNTTGWGNTANGYGALYSSGNRFRNTATGYQALYSSTFGDYNTAIGAEAIFSNTTGDANTADGNQALYSNTTGSNNVGLGFASNYYNQQGSQNTIVGTQAGYGTTLHNKSGNVFLGYQAGYNETGDNKLYIENSDISAPLIWGDFNTDSIRIHGDLHIEGNIHIDGTGGGSSEIDDLTDGKTGGYSVFLGSGAGENDDGISNFNTGIGHNTLTSNESGLYNTAMGYMALFNNLTGISNIAIGNNTLQNMGSGEGNTAIGHNTLLRTVSDFNTAIGHRAFHWNTSGHNNVGLGSEANFYNQAGSNNTIIGYQAGYGLDLHTKSGSVFLGYQAGYNETENNKLYIENSNSSSPLIGGDFATDEIYLNGNVGIGTTSPLSSLSVGGDGSSNSTIFAESPEQYGRGIHGISSSDEDGHNYGGYFEATGTGIACIGLRAVTYGGDVSRAIEGYAANTGDVTNHGGHFQSEGISGVGIYAQGNYRAGVFIGDVEVIGSVSKSSGSFKIDHPLDPENKYLYHSFVESPDMMNIYNGNIVTDTDGNAMVEMPDWFEALNMDFRYQLTVIGEFAQAIVSSEISNNRFSIKTDKPNVKVSWQVTGVRQDAYANANRIPVEEFKNDKERGKYLNPASYNMPKSHGLYYDEGNYRNEK